MSSLGKLLLENKSRIKKSKTKIVTVSRICVASFKPLTELVIISQKAKVPNKIEKIRYEIMLRCSINLLNSNKHNIPKTKSKAMSINCNCAEHTKMLTNNAPNTILVKSSFKITL